MSRDQLRQVSQVSNRDTAPAPTYTRTEIRDYLLIVAIGCFFIGLTCGYSWAATSYFNYKPTEITK